MLLVLAISLALSTQAMPQHSETMTDAQNAGLRGNVKTCTEEQISFAIQGQPERKVSTTTEYTPDGKLLSSRTLYSEGSEYSFSRTYDAQGRLIKQVSGSSGQKPSEKIYKYDDKGRLLTWTIDGKASDTTYSYDDSGHKTAVQRPEGSNVPPGMAIAMGGSEIARPIPAGGSMTTIYNERDQPVEGQIRDAQGQLVTRVVRRYDSRDRILSEEDEIESPESVVPPELLDKMKLNDAQLRGLGAWITANLRSVAFSYSYDSEGRLTGQHRRTGTMEETTTTSYNERGEKAREITTSTTDPAAGVEYGMDDEGNMVPQTAPKPQTTFETEARYEYQYDPHGNWTEMKVSRRSGPDAAFQESEIYHRQLTYY
jgi:YD repeat-containing protein